MVYIVDDEILRNYDPRIGYTLEPGNWASYQCVNNVTREASGITRIFKPRSKLGNPHIHIPDFDSYSWLSLCRTCRCWRIFHQILHSFGEKWLGLENPLRSYWKYHPEIHQLSPLPPETRSLYEHDVLLSLHNKDNFEKRVVHWLLQSGVCYRVGREGSEGLGVLEKRYQFSIFQKYWKKLKFWFFKKNFRNFGQDKSPIQSRKERLWMLHRSRSRNDPTLNPSRLLYSDRVRNEAKLRQAGEELSPFGHPSPTNWCRGSRLRLGESGESEFRSARMLLRESNENLRLLLLPQ